MKLIKWTTLEFISADNVKMLLNNNIVCNIFTGMAYAQMNCRPHVAIRSKRE